MADPVGDIPPPSALLLALEARGVFDIARLFAAAPFLAAAPGGAPQPVIVLPGLGAGDRSTLAIRRYLSFLGYQAHGWNRGRNVRPAGADLPAVAAQIRSLHAATDRPVEGGKPGECGWLTDRFGVSWQIVPSVVPRIMRSGDAAGIERVMRAIMPMKKLDVAKIQQAFGPN